MSMVDRAPCQKVNGRRVNHESFAHTRLGLCRELTGSNLEHCDLVGADLDGLDWSRSTFRETDFSRANMQGFIDRGNVYQKCLFINSNLSGATMGFDGSHFVDCKFEGTKFQRTTFVRPTFERCSFAADLNNVNFEASAFVECSFAGRIESGWFRNGYQHFALVETFGKPPTNTMANVDFSDAILWGVGFSGNLDLSTVIMPRDGKHYFFDRWPYRLRRLSVTSPADAGLSRAVEEFLAIFGPSAEHQHQYIVYEGFLEHTLGKTAAEFVLRELSQPAT